MNTNSTKTIINRNKRLKQKLNRARSMKRGPPPNRRGRAVNNVRKTRVASNGISRRPMPIARNITSRYTKPKIVNRGDIIRVAHREFVTSIKNTTTNTDFILLINQYINPGNPILFPWLKHVATNYDTYVVERLRLHYIPTCPTNTVGQLMLMIDYDAADAIPTTQNAMLNSKNSISFNPYSEKTLNSTYEELNKGFKSKYITVPGNEDSQDVKTLHLGKLLLAGIGLTQNTLLGNLYIEYVIKLKTPTVKAINDPSDDSGEFGISNYASLNFAPASPFLDHDVLHPPSYYGVRSSFNFRYDSGGWDSLRVLPGFYHIDSSVSFSGTATGNFNVGTGFISQLYTIASSSIRFNAVFKATGNLNRLDFNILTFTGPFIGFNNNYIRITPLTEGVYNEWVAYCTPAIKAFNNTLVPDLAIEEVEDIKVETDADGKDEDYDKYIALKKVFDNA